MLLLPRMYVSLKCRVGRVHDVPLLYHVVTHLCLCIIIFLQAIHHHLLLLSILVDRQDLFLKDSEVFLNGGLRFLHEGIDFLDE